MLTLLRNSSSRLSAPNTGPVKGGCWGVQTASSKSPERTKREPLRKITPQIPRPTAIHHAAVTNDDRGDIASGVDQAKVNTGVRARVVVFWQSCVLRGKKRNQPLSPCLRSVWPHDDDFHFSVLGNPQQENSITRTRGDDACQCVPLVNKRGTISGGAWLTVALFAVVFAVSCFLARALSLLCWNLESFFRLKNTRGDLACIGARERMQAKIYSTTCWQLGYACGTGSGSKTVKQLQ